MPTGRQGSIHLFQFKGINVFLHWSWFVFAVYEINGRSRSYSSITWNVAEYLTLFLIVMLHEFGHALACRQVGGQANQIVLWPLGGVAYVNPPARPGATLWSIAAGPLVNVALLPILAGLYFLGRSLGWAGTMPDLYQFVLAVLVIDAVLLVFNMLPIYPLDGGQILRSLLWFLIGRGRSLMVAAILGLIGVVVFIGLAVLRQSAWLGIIAAFTLMNCWGGLKQAQALLRLEKLPRRDGFACPACETRPPIGAYWKCGKCGQPFDTFETQATCPHCATKFSVTKCLDCGAVHPISEWTKPIVSASWEVRR
jgi:Zn-dependent protease/DNA-directed RNA polymerase subunit RPC12/RpoP